jgi:hypothetical protein
LVYGFIGHLYIRLGTTSNYSATTNINNSQIIAAYSKPFPACCIFTGCSLAAASNSGDSLASRAQVLSSRPPDHNSTELSSKVKVNITLRLAVYRQLGHLGAKPLETHESICNSLSDEKMGLSLLNMLDLLSSVRVALTICY